MSIVVDWADAEPTNEERAARAEAVKLCQASGTRESVPTETGEVVAYVHHSDEHVVWCINGGPFGYAVSQGKASRQ